MLGYKILFSFILYEYVSLKSSNNNNIGEKKPEFITNIINYFNFFDNDIIKNYSCIKSLINNPSYIEQLYFGSSFNKNDINTKASCINEYDSSQNEDFIYLNILVNKKKSLYDVLTMSETASEYITGLCFIKGCNEAQYKEILLNLMNNVYNVKHIINNTYSDFIKNNNKQNKFSENDLEIYTFENIGQNYNFFNILLTILEYIPFIIIILHIFFVTFSSLPIYIINCTLFIFCCKKKQVRKLSRKSELKRISKLSNSSKQQNQPIDNDRIPSSTTINSNSEILQKSVDILYNIDLNFTSLSSYQKHSQIINNIGIMYINGLKGIFMIFLLFGNVYMALYGCFITEKNKKNFFFQLKNFLFLFFYIGIRFAPKMLLCAGGFSLIFKFIFFLDGKMDYEIEIIKHNDEGSKEMNSSSASSNKFYNKFFNKNKEKPILSYKYLFSFYLKQMNKYIIYILFLCFFIFSINNAVLLFRGETPLWEFFNEKMITSSKKVYYILPLLFGFKSHIIPLLSNNKDINILDYFYLPFQELFYFMISSLIIFIGYRNNFKIDRFFKIIGILIFIYRIFYYSLNHLDNKDYFNFNEYGKFFNSILYNYNFYICGIIFGMINYVLQKGYAERDLELQEKIYLFSSTKFLRKIKKSKKKTLNIISIICLLMIIIISFFQQIIASVYNYDKEGELQKYKDNIFSQIILFFDSDIYVILFFLLAFCQYIKGDNKINNFFCHNFWSMFNNFYFTYIILINPIILYIIYTTDTKIVFNLSHCFLYTFICGTLVFLSTLLIYSIFELPLKKLINFLIKLRETDIKERLSTIENVSPQEQRFLDNVTASITDIIDDVDDEDN